MIRITFTSWNGGAAVTFEQKKALMDSKKMWWGNYAPPVCTAYSLPAGYLASSITFYTILAGNAADGGLMGYFLVMCNAVYLLGAVRNGSR